MQTNLRLVVLWMMGALAAFVLLAVSIRAMAASLSVFELLALRNFGGIVILGTDGRVVNEFGDTSLGVHRYYLLDAR